MRLCCILRQKFIGGMHYCRRLWVAVHCRQSLCGGDAAVLQNNNVMGKSLTSGNIALLSRGCFASRDIVSLKVGNIVGEDIQTDISGGDVAVL